MMMSACVVLLFLDPLRVLECETLLAKLLRDALFCHKTLDDIALLVHKVCEGGLVLVMTSLRQT